MSSIKLTVSRETFPLAEVFTISRGSRTEANVVVVTLEQNGCRGVGECVPYARYGETLDSVEAQVSELASDFANGLDRAALQHRLPAGAARNAVDCAMWDLQAKQQQVPVWQLAGLSEPTKVTTAYTLPLEDPSVMQMKAEKNASRPLLKIKLGGEGDIERLRAVRAGAPQASIVVDANEGWSVSQYEALSPVLLELGVTMVEQPFAAGDDDALADLDRKLAVCADESCHDLSTLASLHGKYDMINIKLDKTGGLTEAIALRDAAVAEGYQIMVGCMVGTSLAMAPAVLIAAGAEVVDLDGPLLLAHDRTVPLHYEGSVLHPPTAELWG